MGLGDEKTLMMKEEFRSVEGSLWGTKLNEALTVNFGSCGVSDFVVAGVQIVFCTNGGDAGDVMTNQAERHFKI